jgi:Flp pilus assembly protein TadG
MTLTAKAPELSGFERFAKRLLKLYVPAKVMRQLAHPKTSDDSGATAVEFALIVPVFLFLVIGALELSLLLYTYATAGNAARDVARRIATNRLTPATAAAADSAVKPQLPPWVQSSATVSLSQSTPSTAATNQVTVTISFPAHKGTPINFVAAAYGSVTAQTKATYQQESQ